MRSIWLAALALLFGGQVLAAEPVPMELVSPDGSVKVTIEASVGEAPPTYRIERKGEMIIAPSPLGLDILYTKNFGPFDITGTQRRSVDEVHRSSPRRPRALAIISTKSSFR